jgi:DNA primase
MRIFTKESLETLRQKIDLPEVVSSYVTLKRAGSSFKALCPFHDEKTPSFVINKGDTHYHCFGCGAHGDAIEFLMSYQKMSFMDSVEFLADKFGVHLEQSEDKSSYIGPSKSVLKDALYRASVFYHFLLLHSEEGHEALSYLYSRGMDLDFIKTFEIGLAPKQQGIFQKAMSKQSLGLDILDGAGLVKIVGSGVVKEFFNDRIVIPIKDSVGSVIGFSARKFKEETFGPKYINTPETLLFKKSKVLFGLSYCRKKIAKERKAIVVEGQFDALRLIFEGLSIAVAGQGTAFGEAHVKELISLGINKVYLALDGDKAGREAALKIGHLFQKEAIEVYVISLPEGKDPDTFVKEKGPEEFMALLVKALDYLTFMVNYFSRSLDINSPSGKNELINTLIARVKDWDHPLMVHESLRKIAKLTNTPESVIGIDQKEGPNIYIKKTENISSTQVDPDRILETDFLRWLLLVGDSGSRFAEIAKLNLFESHFKVNVCRRLFLKCLSVYQNNKTLDLLSLAIDLDDAEEQLFLSELLQRKINRDRAEEGFIETVQKIMDRKWMEERENIKIKIQSGKFSDTELLELAKKFDEIKNKRPEIVFPNLLNSKDEKK